MKTKLFISIFLGLWGFSCDSPKIETTAPDETPIESYTYNWRTLNTESSYSFSHHSSTLNPQIDEVSGICPMRASDSLFWFHEDSGSDAKVFIFHANGSKKATVRLKSTGARDYEDISLGKDNTVLVADIGDNDRVRKEVKIYQFESPFVSLDEVCDTSIDVIHRYDIHYPKDLGPQDAEAMVYEKESNRVYIFTKASGQCRVLSCELSVDDENLVLEHHLNLDFPRERVTAADFNHSRLMIKTYEHIYFWEVGVQGIIEALKTVPVLMPYKVEAQGEAVCWTWDKGYVTISEYSNSIEPVFNIYHVID